MGKNFYLNGYTETKTRGLNGKKYPTNFRETRNPAVDMVAACIAFYNKQERKLSCIWLHGTYWKLFEQYCQIQMRIKRIPYTQGMPLSFAGVKVEKGSVLVSRTKMKWAFENPDDEPTKIKQEDGEFVLAHIPKSKGEA